MLVGKLAREVGNNMGKKITQQALTKTTWYPLLKKIGVFCQVVIGQCGVSFPSEKAVGFSPVRNWPVIARVLLFHCIRA